MTTDVSTGSHAASPSDPVGLGLVGCGFVADMYMDSLAEHPELKAVAVFDRDPERLAAFASFHKLATHPDLSALLADPAVDIVVNLTNPRSHEAVTTAGLKAGKPVYSEKPLAMTIEGARRLAALAAEKGVGLTGAPCTHLSDAVQTLAKAVATGDIGAPLMAYAEMDDGMIPALDYTRWRSASGAPWPARDEFEVGCTLEHAGYQIAPLVQLFGPVRSVTSVNACRLPDKGEDVGVADAASDVAIGLLAFDDGVVVRLTCSILGPENRSLRVVGRDATATLADIWRYRSPVRIARPGRSVAARARRKLEHRLSTLLPGLHLGRRIPLASPPRAGRQRRAADRMDFARGIAAFAEAMAGGPDRVPTALAVHVTEVTLALLVPPGTPQPIRIESTVPPLPREDWA